MGKLKRGMTKVSNLLNYNFEELKDNQKEILENISSLENKLQALQALYDQYHLLNQNITCIKDKFNYGTDEL